MNEVRIESWFINNNFSENERLVIECSDTPTVEKETEKAVYLRFTSDYGTIRRWFPKSVISGVAYTKGTGKMIKIKTGEIKEISNVRGNLVRTMDGKTYLKSAIEFL